MLNIEEIKNKLLKEKEEIKLILEELNKEMMVIKESQEYEYSGVSEIFEEKQDIHVKKEFLSSRLEAIEKALNKINNNTFGLCLECGKPIEEQRIHLDPTIEYCRKHSR
jgi:DnaK suppressor protein